MKQTAVQWLIEQLTEIHPEAFEKAKEMEKEQIMDAYTADCDTLGHTNEFKVAAEQYYNETFKSE